MKLHTFPPSPNSVKVNAIIHQLGLDVELVHVDLTKGERVDLVLNPNGKIPTLEDGNLVLWESQAIMMYLAEKHDSSLLPKDLVKRAKMNQWMSWNLAHFGAAVAGVIWEKVAPKMMPGYVADQHNLEKSMIELARYGKVLDCHLKERKFVLGDEPSLADISMAAPLIHLQMAELELNEYPHIMKWFGRVMELPYFREALSQAPAGV